MCKVLNKIKIIICILIFSTSLFAPSDISLSQEKASQENAAKIQSEREKRAMERTRKKALKKLKKKKKAMERARKKAQTRREKTKRAMERARKKAHARWEKEKEARRRAKKKKLKGWKKLQRAEELARTSELARLEGQKLKLKKQNLKLEEEKLRLQERKLKEEERAGLEKARQEREQRQIEKRKIALEEGQRRAEELATTRELTRLEREAQEIEKRKIALAEKEKEAEERAEARELVRLERQKLELKKQSLKLEEEKLSMEKQKLKEEKEAGLEKARQEREQRQIEKRKIALEEGQRRAEELAATRELVRLEREKIKEKREGRESERRRIAAKARELARLKKKKLKEEESGRRESRAKSRERKKILGELVEKLLEKHTLTLDECIDVAMKTHIRLKVARKQLKLARFRLFEAKRNLGPTITAKWEDSKGRVSDRLYTGRKFIVEGRQPIFYGGELVFSVRQARVNLEIVESDYDRIKNDLVLQVKKVYYTVDKAKKALVIQKKLQSRAKTLFDMVKAGYEAAVIPQIEFLRISSQYNQTSFQVISAREDISVARLLLQQAIGIEEEIEIAGVKEPEIIKLDLEDCFNLASLNRPEIKISQLSLEYFRYEKKIRQARANWPRVDFLGSYGNTQEDFVAADNIGTDDGTNPVSLIDPRGLGPEYYFGTKISLPIWGSTFGYSYTEEEWTPVVQTTKGTEAKTHTMTFSLLDKLGDISGVKEADVEYMRSLDEINKKKQDITLEVKETFFKYRKAILLMDVAKSKVEFQTKQMEILEIRRELGEALYSDVVEEMIKLAEEEFSYIQAISDYYISIASLNKAIGIDGYFKI